MSTKADTLAQTFNTTRREINSVIRELRKEGRLIGSAKEPPHGYFIPITPEESKEYLNAFRSELFDMLQTYNRQRRAQRSFVENRDNLQLFPVEFSESGQMQLVLARQ